MTAGRFLRHAAAIAVLAAVAFPAAAADPVDKIAGYVDGSEFVRLVGEDSVSVEINFRGALLRAVTRFDPDLSALVSGLESIHAVILTLDDDETTEALRAKVGEKYRQLAGRGWERLGLVRGEGQQVQVLVLNDEETIRGLVVMVVDENEKQMVFANVAGILDLARIEQIGKSMDLPGLTDLHGATGGDE